MGSEIPYYDEDVDEPFSGPFNPEALEDLDELNESWDDAYEDEAARLFQDGAISAPPDVLASDLGAGSGETQLGAAPGSATFEEALPGYREGQPGEPLHSSAVEFAP